MEGDNQYFCETAGKKASSVRLLLPVRHLQRDPLLAVSALHLCGISSGMWYAGTACRQSLTCQPP